MMANELSGALIRAQGAGDVHTESVIIRRIVRDMARRKTEISRFLEKVRLGMSECWYWVGSINRPGYGAVTAGHERRAHRLAWRLANGPIPAGMSVLHKCDVRSCVNPDHLFLGTQSDNMRDCAAKRRLGVQQPGARLAQGIRNGVAALDDDKVRAMRAMHTAGYSSRYIAQEFGVSQMTAYRAVTGRTWVHVV